mgnify:CR=1 FL=1
MIPCGKIPKRLMDQTDYITPFILETRYYKYNAQTHKKNKNL